MDGFKCHMEDEMFDGNFLYFGFAIVVILVNWKSPIEHSEMLEFFRIIVVAFVLLMISLIDFWVDEDRMSVVKHFRTALETAALSLLAISLYLYYTYQLNECK